MPTTNHDEQIKNLKCWLVDTFTALFLLVAEYLIEIQGNTTSIYQPISVSEKKFTHNFVRIKTNEFPEKGSTISGRMRLKLHIPVSNHVNILPLEYNENIWNIRNVDSANSYTPLRHRLVVIHRDGQRLIHRGFDHLDKGVVQDFQRDSCGFVASV